MSDQWDKAKLQAEVNTLRAELAIMTKDRDNQWRGHVEAIAERDALRAQLAEAREALEPFAALESINWVGTMFEGGNNDDAVFYHSASNTSVTLGDFRRARAVYEKIKGGGDE